jgi:hypothetical protein
MTPQDKQSFIREKAREHIPEVNEKILWSLHAVKKLRAERLRKSSVEDLLKSCIIVEEYERETRALPDCLMLGFTGQEPVHVVVALDQTNDRILIVTVYRPSSERWEDDWKRRRR